MTKAEKILQKQRLQAYKYRVQKLIEMNNIEAQIPVLQARCLNAETAVDNGPCVIDYIEAVSIPQTVQCRGQNIALNAPMTPQYIEAVIEALKEKVKTNAAKVNNYQQFHQMFINQVMAVEQLIVRIRQLAKQSYAEGDITIYPRLLNMATTLARSKPLWMAKIMALITQFDKYVAATYSQFKSADQPTKMELLWTWICMYDIIRRATLVRKERMRNTGRGFELNKFIFSRLYTINKIIEPLLMQTIIQVHYSPLVDTYMGFIWWLFSINGEISLYNFGTARLMLVKETELWQLPQQQCRQRLNQCYGFSTEERQIFQNRLTLAQLPQNLSHQNLSQLINLFFIIAQMLTDVTAISSISYSQKRASFRILNHYLSTLLPMLSLYQQNLGALLAQYYFFLYNVLTKISLHPQKLIQQWNRPIIQMNILQECQLIIKLVQWGSRLWRQYQKSPFIASIIKTSMLMLFEHIFELMKALRHFGFSQNDLAYYRSRFLQSIFLLTTTFKTIDFHFTGNQIMRLFELRKYLKEFYQFLLIEKQKVQKDG